MKTEKVLFTLTALNLVLLSYQVMQPRLAGASPADVPGGLRGRALEIVDERGRVRASLAVYLEDPKFIWKGKPYPETVLLRLITADGKPNVKLSTSSEGAGLVVGGASDPSYIQVLAEGGKTTLKLIDKDSAERVIRPEQQTKQ